MSTPPRLRLQAIRKAYPGCLANDDIHLSIAPGEIHALLGENGAGKSTLVKIIYGLVKADSGHMEWEGQPVQLANPAAARRLGIGMVFQHFSLFETLTVVENIALGLDHPPPLPELAHQVREVSAHYGLPLDPHRLVHALSVGERQRVEIVRCLLQKPRLLIMDEPTSVLTPQAVEQLFHTLRRLAAEGVSILYISHKLHEIRTLCHHATVLRQGRISGEADPSRASSADLARLMIGSELPECQRTTAPTTGALRLRVDSLFLADADPFAVGLSDVCLEVRAGQILGIAGIAGNGQQLLLNALNGEQLSPAAAIELDGVAIGQLGVAQRRQLGLGFVPEERLGRGAVPHLSLEDNALLTAHREPGLRRGPWLRRRYLQEFAQRIMQQFQVVAAGLAAEARSLSGGNLQKLIVGREILQQPNVLIISQPTWGVDIGAAALIHQALLDLAAQGSAIVLISEDLDELFTVATHLAVLTAGQLSPIHPIAECTVEQVGRWMGGQLEPAAYA